MSHTVFRWKSSFWPKIKITTFAKLQRPKKSRKQKLPIPLLLQQITISCNTGAKEGIYIAITCTPIMSGSFFANGTVLGYFFKKIYLPMYSPFNSIHFLILSGILLIRFVSIFASIAFHAVFSCSSRIETLVAPGISWIFCSSIPQRFSIGERSGELAGHTPLPQKLIPDDLSQFNVVADVYGVAPSCW